MKDELAQLIALAAATFYSRDRFQRVPDQMAVRCHDLNKTGVLSTNALAAIFGVSTHKIEGILGSLKPTVRGSLNPKHLSILAYVLSLGKIDSATVRALVREGTTLGTIARLTLVSESTLRRRMK